MKKAAKKRGRREETKAMTLDNKLDMHHAKLQYTALKVNKQ